MISHVGVLASQDGIIFATAPMPGCCVQCAVQIVLASGGVTGAVQILFASGCCHGAVPRSCDGIF